MSFTREYKPLFQIEVLHGEPSAGLAGLAFSPTKICQQRMDDHQLLFRQRETGFAVYYQLNPEAEKPLLAEINSRIQFDFGMYVLNAQLSSLFPVPLDDTDGNDLFFDNLSISNEIEISDNTGSEVSLTSTEAVSIADTTSIFSEVFYQDVSLAGNPDKLLVKTRFNNHPLGQFDIPESDTADSKMVKVDLTGENLGAYLLLTDVADAPVKPVYIDRQLDHTAAKGVINIYLDSAQDQVSENGAKFTIIF